MRKLNSRGFTLTELLATLAVLSLVSTIVIYVAINVVNSAKDKSYLVTSNNVEKAAVSYLEENSDKIHFVKYDDNIEYQCVTVQSLIDTNYFDKDVLNSKISKDKVLDSNNYIYIERDKVSKTIKNSKLITDGNSGYSTICGNYNSRLDGDIEFKIPGGYAKEKDILIKYCLYNVSNYKNIEYLYNYVPSDKSSFIKEYDEDNCFVKNIKILDNGELTAEVKDTDIKKSTSITGIDNKAPVIKIEPNGDNTYTKSKTININISDDLSGLSSDSTIKYGFSKSKSEEPSNYEEVNVSTGNVKVIESDLTGEYYLWVKPSVKDNVGNENNGTLVSDVYKFDNTAPSIPTYIAKYRDGSGSYTSGSNANKEVVTEISTTEADSGIEGIYYSKDKSSETKFNFGVSALTQNGSTWSGTESWDFRNGRNDSYYFRACDKAGNCSDWSSIFNIKYKTNMVYIKYHSNGGSMSNNNADYTVNSTSKLVEYKGNSKFHSVVYGGKLNSDGLYNANNSSYIKLVKNGYSVVSGKEWCTKSDGSGTCYDQTTQYSASDFCDASSSDCEVTLYANWKINKLYIRYHANGGSMATNHGTNYTVNSTSKLIEYKGNSKFHSVKYGEKIDLYNTNNSSYINLARTGYSIVSGSEWCTKSDGSGTCYNQVSEYLATSICSSLKTSDCTIDLYAHWKKNTYKCTRAYDTCASGYETCPSSWCSVSKCKKKVSNATKKYTQTKYTCGSSTYTCSTSPTTSDKHTYECSCPEGTKFLGYYGNSANCVPSAEGQRGRLVRCRYYDCPSGYTKTGSGDGTMCVKWGASSCPSGYTKTKEYKFTVSKPTVSSCSTSSSFTCDSTKSGKSYVYSCVASYSCPNGGNVASGTSACYVYDDYKACSEGKNENGQCVLTGQSSKKTGWSCSLE